MLPSYPWFVIIPTIYLQHHGLSPFKLKKDSCLQKDLAFTCREIRKKASFCYGHYVMSVTEMFFTPLQQECQMWQKQLSENLFCIEFNKFCYADEILEITVSQYNNFKSDSLLATFSGFSLVENQQPLFSAYHRIYFWEIISWTL